MSQAFVMIGIKLSLSIGRFFGRVWFYFRMGYSTYLTFLLGYVSTLITVYYLAIKNIPQLLTLFPRFDAFSVLATVIGAPLSVAVGWLHYKNSPAYTSEMDIQVESNPYYFKYAPGYTKEALGPFYLETILLLKKLSAKSQLLDREEEERLDELERKFRVLNEGGIVGTPRRRA